MGRILAMNSKTLVSSPMDPCDIISSWLFKSLEKTSYVLQSTFFTSQDPINGTCPDFEFSTYLLDYFQFNGSIVESVLFIFLFHMIMDSILISLIIDGRLTLFFDFVSQICFLVICQFISHSQSSLTLFFSFFSHSFCHPDCIKRTIIAVVSFFLSFSYSFCQPLSLA